MLGGWSYPNSATKLTVLVASLFRGRNLGLSNLLSYHSMVKGKLLHSHYVILEYSWKSSESMISQFFDNLFLWLCLTFLCTFHLPSDILGRNMRCCKPTWRIFRLYKMLIAFWKGCWCYCWQNWKKISLLVGSTTCLCHPKDHFQKGGAVAEWSTAHLY